VVSDRFLDAGTYYDETSGILVRLTWDNRDEVWRLWKRRDDEWERVPGASLGGDKSDQGIDEAVHAAWTAYEAMVVEDARERAGLES
jgi:hypothetical protein